MYHLIFLNSVDDAIAKVNVLLKNKLDVYYTCSTWVENTDRKAKNAREQKIFWLDIDCGFDAKKRRYKDYKTKEDAMVALRKFTDATKLPAPMVVDSGNGLHCYWPFVDPVAPAVWKTYSTGT